MSYKDIKEMVENDSLTPSDISIRLTTEKSSFKELLQGNLQGGMTQILLKLFGKIYQEDEISPSRISILWDILNSKFSDKVNNFLHNLITESESRKRLAHIHLTNALRLAKAFLFHLPSSSAKQISMLLFVVKGVAQKLEIIHKEDIGKEVEDVDSLLKDVLPQTDKRNVGKPETAKEGENVKPPDDFHLISIFPHKQDIHLTKSPFLRPNLVSTSYQDQDHYLDVHFRLLREDFVRPLREGIGHYRSSGASSRSKKQAIQHVKVYENVTIEYPKPWRTVRCLPCDLDMYKYTLLRLTSSHDDNFYDSTTLTVVDKRGVVHCIRFDPSRFSRVKWKNSKRLMYGNLVCLSHDNFENHLLFGTVADRDPNDLMDGYLLVEFVHSVESNRVRGLFSKHISEDEQQDSYALDEDEKQKIVFTPKIDMNETYTMVESEAYFEAYKHVLKGLQELRKIPLQKYLVQCQNDIEFPVHVKRASVNYNFSPIIAGCSVDISQANATWPTPKDMKLDQSQLKAVRNALTSELSVIQGPPGTGKTHIGLVIMKLLLANRSRDEKSPILVVCYTNHALDQFLEGISEFHRTGIVRVGGRCKRESLKRYTLSMVRRDVRQKEFNRKTLHNLRGQLQHVERQMNQNANVLDASRNILIKLSALRESIPPRLFQQFRLSFHGGENETSCLMKWLGLHVETTMKLKESVIRNETISALSSNLEKKGFNHQAILHAMAVNGCFDEQPLLDWLENAAPRVHNLEPESETLYAFLQSKTLPFNEQELIEEGFNKIEISCAHLSTGSADLEFLCDWLHKQACESESFSGNPEQEEEEEEEEEDEDVDLIQEERMLDEEYRRRDSRSTSTEEQMKGLRDRIAAQTFTDLNGSRGENGWEITREEKKRQKNLLKLGLGRIAPMASEEATDVQDIWKLSTAKRRKLYRRWVKDFHTGLRDGVEQYHIRYNQIVKSIQDLQRTLEKEVLKSADVIGITTTGAAKYRDIVYKLPVKTVIVEEAAEVLEAHVVTSMPESTKQLILIGDHQQLKPSTTVFDLGQNYKLDVSLFERMIKNGTPFTSLSTQHRMRPRIADLLRLNIYEHLKDHESVSQYEDITGVGKNIFFLSHTHHERNISDGRSKENLHEATFLVSFCQYLMQQGYLPDQITILTAYTGQVFAIRRAMKHELSHGVRVSAVDNFQGEENDIILLSLVRSNEKGNIGFLRIENRICVALSRAKKGLYCIGNFEILREQNNIWSNIIHNLEQDSMFGTSLPLHCKNHPEHVNRVATAENFANVPEGGCGQPCEYRLPCGHACGRPCHPDDKKHSKTKCRKPCPNECPFGHKCSKKCSEKCGPCTTLVEKLMPNCSHYQDVPCHQNPAIHICQVPCQKVLKCGHPCTSVCGRPCLKKCMTPVEGTMPCGHQSKFPCYLLERLDLRHCSDKCSNILSCGHLCKGSCKACFQGRLHQKCGQKCTRLLICGHQCREPCSMNCPPCQENCETRCEHSKCGKSCCEPCVPCKEKCEWKCKHYECTLLCSEPCNRPPCNQPCDKKLKCEHSCIGLCGEPCPTFCRICNKEDVEEKFFGDEEKSDARFVQLEDCKHIFPFQHLDEWMNREGDNGEEETGVKLKECPRCKTIIRRSRRYGRIVNQQLQLLNNVKEKIAGKEDEVASAHQRLRETIVKDQLLELHFKTEYGTLRQSEARSHVEVNLLEVKYRSLTRLSKFLESLKGPSNTDRGSRSTPFRRDFDNDLEALRKWLMKPRVNFSEDELEDLECELQRLHQAALLVKASCVSENIGSNLGVKEHLENLHRLLFKDFSPYRKSKKEGVEKIMEKVMEKIKPLVAPSSGISQNEDIRLVRFAGSREADWFICKAGHVFCKSRARDVRERSRCPHCKLPFGEQH